MFFKLRYRMSQTNGNESNKSNESSNERSDNDDRHQDQILGGDEPPAKKRRFEASTASEEFGIRD